MKRRVVGLSLSLLFLVASRTIFSIGAVVHDGQIILSGNDPYFYLHWTEQLLAQANSTTDLSIHLNLPTGEPLLLALLYLAASILPGQPAAPVLAVYPVIVTAVAAGVLYLLAVELTDDYRIGLLSIILLAATPGHALRTTLGFGDHHALDLLWLTVTLWLLVTITRDDHDLDDRPWLLAGGLGVAIAGQLLSWDGSPILLVPIAIYIVASTGQLLTTDRSPIDAHAPLLVAVAVATVVVQLTYHALGWQSATVAAVPAALLAGSILTAVAGELAQRRDTSLRTTVAVASISAIAGLTLVTILAPKLWSQATNGFAGLLSPSPIVETQPLLAGNLRWYVLLGLLPAVALPTLIWASRRALTDIPWLPVVCYGWWLTTLAAVQSRFVAPLSILCALLGAVGTVRLIAWAGLTERSPRRWRATATDGGEAIPTGRRVALIVAIVVVITTAGLVQVPITAENLDTDTDTAETAMWLANNADGGQVIAPWPRSRLFNHMASGNSRSYGQSRRHYLPLCSGSADQRSAAITQTNAQYLVVEVGWPNATAACSVQTLRAHDGFERVFVSKSHRYHVFELDANVLIQAPYRLIDTPILSKSQFVRTV